MGYYDIPLISQARNLCNIILPWVKYQYKRLPTGVSNSPGVFRDKMNKMFRGFESIQVYIYDLLIITKINWSYHLEKLELSQQNIKDNRLKCNIKSSLFGKTEMEYPGFWVTQNGIQSIDKNEKIW